MSFDTLSDKINTVSVDEFRKSSIEFPCLLKTESNLSSDEKCLIRFIICLRNPIVKLSLFPLASGELNFLFLFVIVKNHSKF